MNKKWEFYEENSEEIIDIAKKHNISELLTKILVNRGITDDKEIDTFLNPTRNDFYDPYLMPDMDKAVERIIKAINNQEKVMIYGDYDVDGITSITVLKKFLEERGLKTGHYIPNRLEEGYGLNENAIRSIAEQKYTLMITVDCGISGIEEVELANQLGIETIITDHHEQSESLPNAYAIINAKRKDSQYPFRGLAGCGAVFKLIQAISLRLGLEEKEFLKYLDIVCVGTISDIVPLVDENRVIAKLGLKLVAQTRNIGLRELILQSGYKKIDSNTISFGVAPRINACGRMGYQEEALDLFLTNNIEEARKITTRLNSYNLERQTKEKDIFDRIMELPVLRIFNPFYKKNKEILLYLFFGGLTFLVSIISYAFFNIQIGWNALVANIGSWILAVAFAYITNRIWVFDSNAETTADFIKEITSFVGGRVATLVIEELILFIFITNLGMNSMLVKVVAQVIVIVLNYVISKLIVFKK